jgi:hypothetical protein
MREDERDDFRLEGRGEAMTWEHEIVMDEDEDEANLDTTAEAATLPVAADDDFEAHAWRAQS